MMHGCSGIARGKPSRDPRVIAGELLSLRLDKLESDGKGVPATYEKLLRSARITCAMIDDPMELIKHYKIGNVAERLENFATALTNLRDGLSPEAADRAVISDGLEVNTALINSEKYSQIDQLSHVHPKPGSDIYQNHNTYFQLDRDLRPDLFRSRSEYDDHMASEASYEYYLAKTTETAVSEKAAPLIAELAQSLNISLRGIERQ